MVRQRTKDRREKEKNMTDKRLVADFEFAPQWVWRKYAVPINAFVIGTGSAYDALNALDGYSQDIWGSKASYLNPDLLGDPTSERADRWNAFLGHVIWSANEERTG